MAKKLLVLDLDETLIHAQAQSDVCADFYVGQYRVWKRPFVDEFLAFCRKHFDIAIWTSANRVYADAVVKKLFTDDYPLAFVWSSSRCTNKFSADRSEMISVKDAKKIKRRGYDLNRTIIVDDSPEKHVRNYGNLVRVTPYTGNNQECELVALMVYLSELNQESNVRTVEKRGWQEKFAKELI